MTLSTLSHRARAALRAFLARWIAPKPRPVIGLPPDLVAAIAAEREARERKQTQLIHHAREKAKAGRHDALRREVAARMTHS